MDDDMDLPGVFIAGVGLTPVGEHWDRSLREIGLEAITAARDDAGGLAPQALYVGNMLAPALSGQTHLGVLMADYAGLRGIEAASFEAAGASGGVALRQAYLAVASGAVDVALVLGVEKPTDQIGPAVDAALAAAADADFEGVQGMTQAAQAALLMRRYMHEYHVPLDGLAGFSLTAHANALANPNAMYRRALRPEDYASAPKVSDPVNLMDAAPVADGAAAILLTRGEHLPDNPARPRVQILASAVSTTALALHDQPDLLGLAAAAESARKAYAQAGVSPEDIDLFELHDLFSIYAALSLEAAGFAPRGEGWRLAADGAIARQGRIPISTFGGSKARGDAAGATGVYQAAEVVLQLQARGGEAQVAGARVGMAQCLGGAGATAATHILSRPEGS
ncbi:MAG: thiolase domain-containing protein [Anaerolineales bacterium]|nr:thiolase domain-containing protein [Anaerolineales bacterium]